jgi:hypothetical protein
MELCVLTVDETWSALLFPALVEALAAAFRLDVNASLCHHHAIPNTGEDVRFSC